jgi:hypothetical protein
LIRWKPGCGIWIYISWKKCGFFQENGHACRPSIFSPSCPPSVVCDKDGNEVWFEHGRKLEGPKPMPTAKDETDLARRP